MIKENNFKGFNLIQDQMSPSEAKEIVNNYYNKLINHYKVEKLKMWVGNHKVDTSYYDELIKSVLIQKKDALDTISSAARSGQSLELKGNLNFSLVA